MSTVLIDLLRKLVVVLIVVAVILPLVETFFNFIATFFNVLPAFVAYYAKVGIVVFIFRAVKELSSND